MAVLRQLGVRYQSEIDEERRGLHNHLYAQQATPPTGDIPATHPTGRPTKNDYVETASGRIKPASQA